MAVMGFRCSNTDFAYVVVTGTKAAPKLLDTGHFNFPKGFSDPETLVWFQHEVRTLIERVKPQKVVMKRAEVSVRRSNSLEFRFQIEGVLTLTAAQMGCKDVRHKVSPTIAKDFGMKGRAKYLKSFDTSAMPEYADAPLKTQEAILVAWSSL